MCCKKARLAKLAFGKIQYHLRHSYFIAKFAPSSLLSRLQGDRPVNVSLNEHLEKFVTEVVAAGRFKSSSEVIREGLRLLEQRELNLLCCDRRSKRVERARNPLRSMPTRLNAVDVKLPTRKRVIERNTPPTARGTRSRQNLVIHWRQRLGGGGWTN